ncbi:hypothetical protein [Streptomyces sp. NPDC054804]
MCRRRLRRPRSAPGQRLPELAGEVRALAGAHHGRGVHEDGAVPASRPPRRRECAGERRTGSPRLHDRARADTTPRRYALRHRAYMWLIDPDRPPHLPFPLRPLARFDPRDHFTGDRSSIRAGLDDFLAGHGVHLDGGRV